MKNLHRRPDNRKGNLSMRIGGTETPANTRELRLGSAGKTSPNPGIADTNLLQSLIRQEDCEVLHPNSGVNVLKNCHNV
jgi:hypothetical protein